jgi:hypothetical protein
MAVTVAALAVFTFFAPGSQPTPEPQEIATAFSSYSAEEVIFDQDDLSENQMSYDQVLTTLYQSDQDTVR